MNRVVRIRKKNSYFLSLLYTRTSYFWMIEWCRELQWHCRLRRRFQIYKVIMSQKYATDGTYRRKDIPVAAASERLLVDWFLPTFVFVSRSQRTSYMAFTGIYQFDICLHHHDRWTGDDVYGDMRYAEYYVFVHTSWFGRRDWHRIGIPSVGQSLLLFEKVKYGTDTAGICCRAVMNVDPIDIGRTCHHRTLLYSKYVILVSIHDIENDPQ